MQNCVQEYDNVFTANKEEIVKIVLTGHFFQKKISTMNI